MSRSLSSGTRNADAVDTVDAAALLAVDPAGLGGALLAGDAAQAEAWCDRLARLMPRDTPRRRVPSGITADRLLGGLDLAATLAAGRVVVERGVLAAADGGLLVLAAGRTRAATWPHVAAAMDEGEVAVQRDGVAARHPARFAAVVHDDADAPAPRAIVDRLAFVVDVASAAASNVSAADVAAARSRLSAVRSDDAVEALVRGAASLGIANARALGHALAAARAAAALAGRDEVDAADVAVAARLVLAPRATALPDEVAEPPASEAPESADAQHSPPDALPDEARDRATDERPDDEDDTDATPDAPTAEVVVRAARAALPAGLLAGAASLGARAAGRAGADGVPANRGRQVGVRRGDPRTGARLDVVATLRAAAPMQRVRRAGVSARVGGPRVLLARDDFRVRSCVTKAQTTTLFVVDASGSSALRRLAEAKGAVELLLAEGYARRERVAVIAFRGREAELVLPPTSALARARRAVAGLPAGGGTPLAAALDLAARTVVQARRDAGEVVTVLLTDGRANVARDGTGGRPRAEADALDAARAFASLGSATVLLDTGERPDPFTRQVAAAMGARYVALPRAAGGSGAVSAAAREARRG